MQPPVVVVLLLPLLLPLPALARGSLWPSKLQVEHLEFDWQAQLEQHSHWSSPYLPWPTGAGQAIGTLYTMHQSIYFKRKSSLDTISDTYS